MNNIERVHVVFKTHLDIGFTDLAENIVSQYMNQYIPAALSLAEELKSDPDCGFIWTTGSWMISEYLRLADETSRQRMEKAIDSGLIAWHGLPFTTHTELMDVELFNYGISISKDLDHRFNRQTIATKMTDVPGHTRGIIKHLANNGLEYLHIGVNPTCTVPDVPPVFLWTDQEGNQLIVNYAADYGKVLQVDGLKDVLVFAHTGDNCGPPSKETIQIEFEKLRKKFPGAKIQASTLDAFAKKLIQVKEKLPVLTEEIGDTWIHGIGTDPKKVSHYRQLLRLRDKWIEEGSLEKNSLIYKDFSRNLALIAEHTWGLDLKKYFLDYKNYSASDFNAARERDILTQEDVPEKYKYIRLFAMDELKEVKKNAGQVKRSYSFFESSWKEQRMYLNKALDALPDALKNEAKEALASLEIRDKDVEKEGKRLNPKEVYSIGELQVGFNEKGAISHLVDMKGHSWADSNHQIGAFSYEAFGVEDYEHWFNTYMRDLEKTYRWADSDYSKPGMEFVKPRPKHKLFYPHLEEVYQVDSNTLRCYLSMPREAVKELGAPARLVMEYKCHRTAIDITCIWMDKNPCRLPEGTWLSFNPKVNSSSNWLMDKMGQQVSPLDVVKNGNRNLHGVLSGVSYEGGEGKVRIDTYDAPLLSPGTQRLLRFDNRYPDLEGGMHFNLNNNIWGTNFPMWYEEDAKFRFRVEFVTYNN